MTKLLGNIDWHSINILSTNLANGECGELIEYEERVLEAHLLKIVLRELKLPKRTYNKYCKQIDEELETERMFGL